MERLGLNPEVHPELANILVTMASILEPQLHKSWLKLSAAVNIIYIELTLDTSHCPISWLKACIQNLTSTHKSNEIGAWQKQLYLYGLDHTYLCISEHGSHISNPWYIPLSNVCIESLWPQSKKYTQKQWDRGMARTILFTWYWSYLHLPFWTSPA